jgi:hypothetical protein
MQTPEPEPKQQTKRLAVELTVMVVVFLGLILGTQALQGTKPQFDPLAKLWGTVHTFMMLSNKNQGNKAP